MKKFVWRLQRVLDIKIKEEQIKRAELLEITERLTFAQSELLMQKRILTETINSLSKVEPKKRLDSQELFLKYSAINDELIENLTMKVRQIEKEQKDKIGEIIKIKQFRKSLEKLREETKNQFMKEQEKIEQKEADEMTTIAVSRRIMNKELVSSAELRS
ncbi:MAG: Flagellar FliJ protein [Planctomycetes bacterium ADurb.Bin401]|nr:MAG: Flagellar FliJ protein [Planctomycetes bacterium ADurb.Bin401]